MISTFDSPLTTPNSPLYCSARPGFDCLGINPGGDGNVLQGDAERFEHRHVLGVGTAGEAADDDLAELMHVGPVNGAVFESLHEIARFQTGLIFTVDNDRFT